MNWRWVGLLGGMVIVACAQAAQPNDDDDGGTGGIIGFTTSSAGASTGGATQSAVNSTVTSANSTVASVAVSTVGAGPASVASTTSGSMNCAQQPTFEACADCYCLQDPNGCQAYINVIETYIYCGGECGSECSLYCSTLNPIDITTTCDLCIANFDCSIPSTTQMQQDCNNFVNGCTANTACINFATSLQNCP